MLTRLGLSASKTPIGVQHIDTYYGLPSDKGLKWNRYNSSKPSPKGGQSMRFYTLQHKYYCGIDLHARKMYVCILDQKGKIRVHKNIRTNPEILFELIFSISGGCHRLC